MKALAFPELASYFAPISVDPNVRLSKYIALSYGGVNSYYSKLEEKLTIKGGLGSLCFDQLKY